LFVRSGAEAVENAVKIARYYRRRAGVISFDNAFHGRTLLTLALTSKVPPVHEVPGLLGARHLPGALSVLLPLPVGTGVPALSGAVRGGVLRGGLLQASDRSRGSGRSHPGAGPEREGLHHPAKGEALGRRVREELL